MPYAAVLESLRFIKRFRERQLNRDLRAARERQLEREHQQELVRMLFENQLKVAQLQADALKESLEATKTAAETLLQWVKGFQIPTPSAPEVPPVEEPMENPLIRAMMADGMIEPDELPAEFALAFSLKKEEEEGTFDREGSDFIK